MAEQQPETPPLIEVRDSGDGTGEMRVMSLGTDSAGGYAVPVQLDGAKEKRPKRD
jgi:hypothetical protein